MRRSSFVPAAPGTVVFVVAVEVLPEGWVPKIVTFGYPS